jgi:rhodanese-related sulfurtransferase
MKKNILLFVLTLFAASNFMTAQDTSGTAIGQQRFEKMMKKKKAVVLDVRTADEFKEGFIPKAINYNVLDSLDFVRSVQLLDKKKKYLLYCKSGRRSGKALVMMKQMGFKNIHHLSGGITAWKGEIEKPQ